MTIKSKHLPKSVRKIDPNDLPKWEIENKYDKYGLDFFTKKDGKVYNDTFDVTDAPDKLYGVPTGQEEIKLTDYLVYRPVPKELLTWRNMPDYHPDSLDMENWYRDLIDYCKDGVWIDGEYWNPYMVYWLNVFVFPVPKKDEEGNLIPDFDPGHPFYCNIDRYILDIAWKARLTGQDVSLMGGRGIGKSYLWGCIMDREYRLYPNSWTVVSSTNEETTSEAWNKIEECLTAIEKLHRALKHKRISDSLAMKYAGEVIELADGTTEDRGYLSKMEKITYGKNAGKTRGKRPTIQLIEEFAAFPPSNQKGDLKSCMRESRGSWYVMGAIKKCTVLYSGTGGTVENDQAEGIFMDPIASECIPTWDWVEAGEKGCGIFIPTHIKRAHTWEKTGCPDITKGRTRTEEERAKKKSDPVAYMGLLQEFPMTLREVFMRRGVNIFDQDKIATQRTAIDFGGPESPKPGRGFLVWRKDESGKNIGVDWDPAPTTGDVSILEHPHWLQDNVEEKDPMKNLYVGGCDSIDQGTMDSAHATDSKKGSELAILIKKRIVDKGYFKYTSNIYVAKYNKRSGDVRSDWDNALKLAVYYNSEVNIEYTKIGVVGWFRDNGYYHLLKKRPSIALNGANPNKATMLIGTQTSTQIIDHMDGKIKQYIDDNYKKIWFPDILEQCQDYDRENRTKFDMVIAMGLCELTDEDLMGKVARPPAKATSELVPFGYYTDENGYKRHGIIPQKGGSGQEEMDNILAAERFREHGSVRWEDASDRNNIKSVY